MPKGRRKLHLRGSLTRRLLGNGPCWGQWLYRASCPQPGKLLGFDQYLVTNPAEIGACGFALAEVTDRRIDSKAIGDCRLYLKDDTSAALAEDCVPQPPRLGRAVVRHLFATSSI